MVHASVAALNQYDGDPDFDRVMNNIEAAQEEGDINFEVDLMGLDEDMVSVIMEALYHMGYEVDNTTHNDYLMVKYE